MSLPVYDSLKKQLDEWVREGKAADAVTELSKIPTPSIPRKHAADFAWIAARAGSPDYGIRLLHPMVRDEKNEGAATEEEIASYAFCLAWIGANDEALELIRGRRANGPKALFAESAALMGNWQYREAIPLLDRYVASKDLLEYDRLVGTANLCSAMVYERKWQAVDPLLEHALAVTSTKTHSLLNANLLILSAYSRMMQNKFSDANRLLGEATKKLKNSPLIDELFVRKWTAISTLREKSDAKPIKEVLTEATRRQHWETVRDCERFLAITLKDEALLWKVYFGTPYEGFRKRLLSEFGENVTAPLAWDWPNPSKSAAIVLVSKGRMMEAKKGLPEGRSLHRLLSVLSADLYRPLRLASLFSKLFPGDFYNPESSPARVHQAVKLLRKALEKDFEGVSVTETSSFYSLKFDPKVCVLRLERGLATATKREQRLEEIEAKAEGKPFSLQDAVNWLQAPRRTVQRVIDEGLKEKRLSRDGKSTATRYSFTQAIKRRA